MEDITLEKEVFDAMKPMLKPYLKEHCNYCGCKITKDTFGLLAREITCCKSFICLTEAIEDLDKLKQKKDVK